MQDRLLYGSCCAGDALFGLLKQAHLAEGVSGIQVGDDNFLAFIIFEDNGNRTLDDVMQGIAFVAFINNGGSIRVTLAIAVG